MLCGENVLTTFALLSRKSPENMAFITSHRAVRIALWAGTLPSSNSNITSAKRPTYIYIEGEIIASLLIDRYQPCSRQMSSNRCLTTCLYRLLRSLLTNCSRVCMLPSTMSNCGSSRNSAACLISCRWEKNQNVSYRCTIAIFVNVEWLRKERRKRRKKKIRFRFRVARGILS